MILAAAQDATPSGAPDPDLVTPGTIGFLVTLVIVLVVIVFIRDALKRVRRVRARSHADDSYPIPLRKHAVPNQSKLSGESAPSAEETSTLPESAKSEKDPFDSETTDSQAPDSGHDGSEQSGPTRGQD